MTDAASQAASEAEAGSRGPTEESRRTARHGRAVQVFARDVRLPLDAPLVRLHLGQADALRADARAGHLICPIAGCEDPRLTTRAGSRRDHFAHHHRVGAAHGAETIAHHTAKHLLAAWLRERWPEALVHCDDHDVEDGQRPDVLLELPHHPAGPIMQAPEAAAGRSTRSRRQVAYEVQFASLSAQEWRRRHDRYVAQSIRDVWLFGGIHYDRPHRGRAGSAASPATASADIAGVPALGELEWGHPASGREEGRAWSPIFTAVLSRRHPLLFIDPDTERVGLGGGDDVDKVLAWCGDDASPGRKITVLRYPLTQARCPSGVIDLPPLRAQLDVARERHAREADRRAAVRRDRQQQQERRRMQEERYDAAVSAWRHHRQELEALRGPLPAVIDQEPHEEEVRLPRAPQHWRWRLALALAAHIGQRIDPSALFTFTGLGFGGYDDEGTGTGLATRCVARYLVALRSAGLVWFAGHRAPRSDEALLVLHDPSTPQDLSPDFGGSRIGSLAGSLDDVAVENIDALRLHDSDGYILWSTPSRHPTAWETRLNAIASARRGRLLLHGITVPTPADTEPTANGTRTGTAPPRPPAPSTPSTDTAALAGGDGGS